MAEELAAFPMVSHHKSDVDWGLSDSDGTNYQPIIKVAICASQTGNLEVAVDLADHLDSRIGLRGAFSTDFPALQRFAEKLQAMMCRECEEAILTGANVP